jgi:hypothetical protein
LNKSFWISLALTVFAAAAQADTIDVQLGAGTTGALNAGPDVVETVGGNFDYDLTLNVPTTETFYVPFYEALCTTCSGSVTGTLTSSTINISDSTVFGSGTGAFAQKYSDASSGDVDTFTPLASSPISITLTNGDTLVITPLAGAASAQSAPSLADGTAVSATFLLEKTAAVPEPSGVLPLLSALAAMVFLTAKKNLGRKRL